MKTKMKLMSVVFLSIYLLVMMVGISGCSSNCPPKGKWKTDNTVGLIGFEVSKCTIQYIGVAVDLNSAGSPYGLVFDQEYIQKYGNIHAILIPVECIFESDGQFTCQKDYVILTGKFISEYEAQGELHLPRGLDLGNGFTLGSTNGSFDIASEWSATLLK